MQMKVSNPKPHPKRRRLAAAPLTTALLLSLTVVGIHAEELGNSQAAKTFLPDIFYLRNPLKNKGEGNKVIRFDSSYGMDNDDLSRAVAHMQDTSMSTSHRLLNHQWLSTYEGNDNPRRGGKAISQLFLTGLKTFWDNHYGNKLYQGKLLNNKQGSAYQEMDYRIRLSDDSVKMSLEYSF